MKNLLVIISAFLITASVINAQPNKYGYINTSQLLNVMPESKEADLQMRNEVAKLEEELDNLNVEYQNKLQKYVEEQESLTAVVKQLRERELVELQTRMQEFQSGAQEGLQQRRAELLQPIFDRIDKAISEVAREKGYYFVFDIERSGILYYDDETEDIYPFVSEKLGL
ncbi:MAG: OmpH family outer membrane protein [Bacteroidales bacterium]|jgi:outer membrane protein